MTPAHDSARSALSGIRTRLSHAGEPRRELLPEILTFGLRSAVMALRMLASSRLDVFAVLAQAVLDVLQREPGTAKPHTSALEALALAVRKRADHRGRLARHGLGPQRPESPECARTDVHPLVE